MSRFDYRDPGTDDARCDSISVVCPGPDCDCPDCVESRKDVPDQSDAETKRQAMQTAAEMITIALQNGYPVSSSDWDTYRQFVVEAFPPLTAVAGKDQQETHNV